MPLITDPDIGALSERWTLDGLGFHLAPWRILSLTRTLPAQRPSWLENPDADGAILLEDPKVTNAELVFRLMLDEQDSKDAALEKIRTLEAKLAECSKTPTGLPLVWEPYGASARLATIACLAAEIVDVPIGLDGDGWWWFRERPVITVRLVTEPFGDLETETGPTDTSTTGEPVEIVFEDVPGTASAKAYPITITNDDTDDARTFLWGAGLDTTSPLTLAAGTVGGGTLVTSGFGGIAGTVSGELVVTSTVYSSTQSVCGTGEQAHQGTYRVLGRVYCEDESTECRLAWQANDGPWTVNDWKSPPVVDAFGKVDLGLVTLTDSGVGTQTWQGRVEATGVDDFAVERLQLIPVDVGYGVARAPSVELAGNLVAFDDFTGTSAGTALGTRTPPVGAAWATSGAATDFAFLDFGGIAVQLPPSEAIGRSASSASLRYAVLGSSMTDQQVTAQVGAVTSTTDFTGQCGVIARWVDASNHLRATAAFGGATGPRVTTLTITKVIAGTPTVLAARTLNQLLGSWFCTISALVTANGNVTVQLTSYNGVVAELTANDSALATGGTLDDGKPGVVDSGDGTHTVQRWYDLVTVYEPAAQPVVIYNDQDVQLTHESILRGDATGDRYGRPLYTGGYLRIPQAGDPDRSTRMVMLAHSGDLDVDAWDPVGLPISVATEYIPRVKVVP